MQTSIGAELSLAVDDIPGMTLTHAGPGSTSTTARVVSTWPTWTLAVSDAGADTPGHMDGASHSLEQSLRVRSEGQPFVSLTGTDQVLSTGGLVDTRPVDFAQGLAADEDVFADDAYSLTARFSVTAQ